MIISANAIFLLSEIITTRIKSLRNSIANAQTSTQRILLEERLSELLTVIEEFKLKDVGPVPTPLTEEELKFLREHDEEFEES